MRYTSAVPIERLDTGTLVEDRFGVVSEVTAVREYDSQYHVYGTPVEDMFGEPVNPWEKGWKDIASIPVTYLPGDMVTVVVL